MKEAHRQALREAALRRYASHKGICRTCKKKITKEEACPYPLTRNQWVCLDCERIRGRKKAAKYRQDLIKQYGGKCQCLGCDVTTPEFLTVDHIDGKGHLHRHPITGRKINLNSWLKVYGYPKYNFRLLCWNCNCARGKYGYCPHEVINNTSNLHSTTIKLTT